MRKRIEVEIRAFISENQYKKLLSYFKKNGKLITEDNQETIYFDCKEDLRIQQNDYTSKIWLKSGNIHDDCREEIEVHTQRDSFKNLKDLFKNLGYGIDIRWIRKRKEFDWDGIDVCLDYTVGYGYIIELEKVCTKGKEKEVLSLLRGRLKELGIKETSKDIFNKAYENYRKNWKKLISKSTSTPKP